MPCRSLYISLLNMKSLECFGEIFEGTTRLEKYFAESPELKLLLGGERADALTHVDLTPPVNVEDHLEVLRITEIKNNGWLSRDVSVAEICDLLSGGSQGYLAQPRAWIAPQVSHPRPELFPCDIDHNGLPVSSSGLHSMWCEKDRS